MRKKQKQTEDTNGEPRKTISFRPAEGVDEMVAKAQIATGSNPTELCNEALKYYLPLHVARKAEERRKEAEEFAKKYKNKTD